MYKNEASPERSDVIIDFIKNRVDPEQTNKLHKHPYSEIVIISSGDMTYSSGSGIENVGEKSVIFNRTGLIHHPFVKQTPIYERYKVKFYEEDLFSQGNDNSFLQEALKNSFIKPLSDEDFNEIYTFARSIYRAKNDQSDSPAVREYCLASLRAMLLKIAISGKREQQRQESYIADAVTYIKNNLHTSLTISKIASCFFVSKSKLIYDFKAYCNMSINEYITIARIEKAKDLLSRGYSVVSVAEKCGFSSASYFIKVFSSMLGTTPLKYQVNNMRGLYE